MTGRGKLTFPRFFYAIPMEITFSAHYKECLEIKVGKEITPRKERGDEEVDRPLFISPFKSRRSYIHCTAFIACSWSCGHRLSHFQ